MDLNENILDNESWEDFPRTYIWKEAVKFIQQKCNDTNKIKEVLRILINEANTVEDKVLTLTILYLAYDGKHIDIETIKEKYGEDISNLIIFMTQNEDENFNQYASRIFNCEDNKYIRKIILASELYALRMAKETHNDIQSALDRANIILSYRNTHIGLLKKLEKEIII